MKVMGLTLCKTLGSQKDFILLTISMEPGAPTIRFVSVRVKTTVSVRFSYWACLLSAIECTGIVSF